MAEIRLPYATRTRAHAPAGAPSARAGLVAGLIAGTVAFALMQWLAIVAYDESPWKLPRMMAALVRGPGVLDPQDEFDAAVVGLGIGVHYTLSLLYALALAGVSRELPLGRAPLAGLAMGVLLYAANLHGFTALFPWFAPMQTPDTLVAHAVFGLVAGCAYCELLSPRLGDRDG